MVGVGIDGSESVLARVSIVNFYGFTLLDAIVRPRERVVNYRTEFSGIRPSDMVHGAPFFTFLRTRRLTFTFLFFIRLFASSPLLPFADVNSATI